ncbi:MAG: GrpB family protein [Micromonosporaceae bacterium]
MMPSAPDPAEEPVRLEPYHADWPARFEREAAAIRAAIGDWITGGIHHIGSTAVPGLIAKPIIDIQVGVADLASSRPCIAVLAELDYQYAPYRAEEMHWFCKPDPRHRTHHLHLVPTGSPRFLDTLALRDYLREHPHAAAEYVALKQDLAARFTHDREAYTDGKAELVARLTRAARERTPAGTALRQRLRQALSAALKARDPNAVNALRTALAAIENAEAVDGGLTSAAGLAAVDGLAIEQTPVGAGVTEVPRRVLTEAEVAEIVRTEVVEREAAARDYERANQPERAQRLRNEASVLAAHLAGPA